MKQLTFLDLCSGIGGFRVGLETAGHKCVGYCEYDKFARASYEAMYDTKGEWKAHDITKLRAAEVPYTDIWCFGFPCQDISVAGKQRGLIGKRSGIYYNIIDLIKGKEESAKPTYLLVENVKNLLSVNSGFDFASVLLEMDEAGYDCQWQVLNSKNFGVPQNRERVYIVGCLRSRGGREILPVTAESSGTLKKVVGGMQGYRVYDSSGVSATLAANAGGVGAKTGLYFIDQSSTKPKLTVVARCITARYTAGVSKRTAQSSAVVEARAVLTPDRLEKRQNGRRIKEHGEPMFTLTGQDRHGVLIRSKKMGNMGTVMKYGRIRRLTPKECFRLQGFADSLFKRAEAVNSDAQLYKQAGNAVTATVAYALAMSLPESREN